MSKGQKPSLTTAVPPNRPTIRDSYPGRDEFCLCGSGRDHPRPYVIFEFPGSGGLVQIISLCSRCVDRVALLASVQKDRMGLDGSSEGEFRGIADR